LNFRFTFSSSWGSSSALDNDRQELENVRSLGDCTHDGWVEGETKESEQALGRGGGKRPLATSPVQLPSTKESDPWYSTK
jgi:hypothetical protein